MTTVLVVGNSEGEQRCDAKCHDAHSGECQCVCDGRYHGRGAPAEELVHQDIERGVFAPEVHAPGVTPHQLQLLGVSA